jgi:hypothetical protein
MRPHPGVKGEAMADPVDKAKREAEAAAADDKFAKLVEAFGGTASAQAVFGAPVERDGVTVVPVARIRYGVGGGACARRRGATPTAQSRSATGRAAACRPRPSLHELRDGQASYKRIADPARPLAPVLLFPLVGVLAFAIVTLINAWVASPASSPESHPTQTAGGDRATTERLVAHGWYPEASI